MIKVFWVANLGGLERKTLLGKNTGYTPILNRKFGSWKSYWKKIAQKVEARVAGGFGVIFVFGLSFSGSTSVQLSHGCISYFTNHKKNHQKTDQLATLAKKDLVAHFVPYSVKSEQKVRVEVFSSPLAV